MKDRLHIVHVISTTQAGGVEKLVLGLATSSRLSAHRHSVVCVRSTQGQMESEFQEAGVDLVYCPFPWPDRLPIPSYTINRWIRHQLARTFPMRFGSLLKRMGADVVHTHLPLRIHLQAAGVLRKARLPWVWTLHALYRPEGVELAQWRAALALMETRRACITADSGGVVEHFHAWGLRSGVGPRVVYAGADVARFSEDRPRDPRWRERWGIPSDAVVFGAAGRLVPVKAHGVFIRAASLLAREDKDAHFVIAGSGPLQSELEAEIARLGLAHRFHLVGYDTDVPAYLRQIDIFVLPSRSEGFPLALIEALAAGRPCIATSVGGVPEMLGAEDGLIVPPESPERLAEAMSLMLNPETRTAFSRRGPEIAQRFSYESCADQFQEIYRSLLA